MQDRRGLLKMLFASYCNSWLKYQRNCFPLEETDIVKRQAKTPGPLRFIQLQASQQNVNVFNPGQCATMAELHTHHVHLSDTTVVQLATQIPKETKNLLYLNNKYFRVEELCF